MKQECREGIVSSFSANGPYDYDCIVIRIEHLHLKGSTWAWLHLTLMNLRDRETHDPSTRTGGS